MSVSGPVKKQLRMLAMIFEGLDEAQHWPVLVLPRMPSGIDQSESEDIFLVCAEYLIREKLASVSASLCRVGCELARKPRLGSQKYWKLARRCDLEVPHFRRQCDIFRCLICPRKVFCQRIAIPPIRYRHERERTFASLKTFSTF